MAKMTPEEVSIAIDEMADAGINEREIESFLQGQGVMPVESSMDLPTGQQGLQGSINAAQVIIPGVTAGVGGSLARMGLAKLAPKATPYLGPIASGIGEAVGAFGGGMATGMSPEQAATGAAISGGIGTAVEGGAQMFGRGFARAGKVTPRTMRETTAQGGFNRLRTTMGGVGEEEYVNEAERLRRAATGARVAKSPGRAAAERKISAFDRAHTTTQPTFQPPFGVGQQQVGGVDFEPVKQRILSLVDDRATTTGRLAVNEQLRRVADRLPASGTMDDLDHFIREHTEPIKGQVQNLEASLPIGVQQKIVAGARRYRNQLLPEAKADFVKAQNYLKATKNIRSMLVDKNGDLRKTAEGIWRTIPRNKVILRSFQEFDRVHGTDFAEKALDLARRANWSPGDGATALGMIDASVGWFGRAAATTTRGVGKVLVGGAIPAGRTSAAAAAAFYSAMQPRANP